MPHVLAPRKPNSLCRAYVTKFDTKTYGAELSDTIISAHLDAADLGAEVEGYTARVWPPATCTSFFSLLSSCSSFILSMKLADVPKL